MRPNDFLPREIGVEIRTRDAAAFAVLSDADFAAKLVAAGKTAAGAADAFSQNIAQPVRLTLRGANAFQLSTPRGAALAAPSAHVRTALARFRGDADAVLADLALGRLELERRLAMDADLGIEPIGVALRLVHHPLGSFPVRNGLGGLSPWLAMGKALRDLRDSRQSHTKRFSQYSFRVEERGTVAAGGVDLEDALLRFARVVALLAPHRKRPGAAVLIDAYGPSGGRHPADAVAAALVNLPVRERNALIAAGGGKNELRQRHADDARADGRRSGLRAARRSR